MEKMTELVFILDRSGSMSGYEKETIKGYNKFLEEQKNNNVRVTTYLFNDEVEIHTMKQPIKDVPFMKKDDFMVGGCTALLDAVGKAFLMLDEATMNTDKNVIMVIITDGMENSSRYFNYDNIKYSINYHRELGWNIIFMGADINVEETADILGIDKDMAVKFKKSKKGVEANFKAVSYCCDSVMSGSTIDGFKELIDKDDK